MYGNIGQSGAGNMPGARGKAASWVDSSGNFYLLGGEGFDSAGNFGTLNDLWKFDPKTRQWTWMSGSSVVNLSHPNSGFPPVYGELGTPALGNNPGSRQQATGWTDRNGKIWLFGGSTTSSLGLHPVDIFNDLWEFDPITALWTWWGGSDTLTCLFTGGPNGCVVNGAGGVYGALSSTAAENAPGSRSGATAWSDKNGDAWLFGGLGFDSAGLYTDNNDLWEFQFKKQPAVELTSSAIAVFEKNAITLSAAIRGGSAAPTGMVTFLESGIPLGSGTLDAGGKATLTLDNLAMGSHQITANYGGDLLNLPASSGKLAQTVEDFSLVPASSESAVAQGATALILLSVSPVTPATVLPAAVTLAATGGPAGATYTFGPASVAGGQGSTNVTLKVALPTLAELPHESDREVPAGKSGPLWLCWLMLPVALRLGARNRRRVFWHVVARLMAGAVAIWSLSGCASFTWVSHSQTYSITVTAQSGAMSHASTVTLKVQ
jgi:hypothetical protein